MENGITNGTSASKFSPNDTCTRGRAVTFLWRAAGQPEPKITFNPFTDIKSDAYYYKAVLWAIENGITNGTSTNTFSPNDVCTRGQIVTFLWRANNKPAPKIRPIYSRTSRRTTTSSMRSSGRSKRESPSARTPNTSARPTPARVRRSLRFFTEAKYDCVLKGVAYLHSKSKKIESNQAASYGTSIQARTDLYSVIGGLL